MDGQRATGVAYRKGKERITMSWRSAEVILCGGTRSIRRNC
jgi:hypothetical protein